MDRNTEFVQDKRILNIASDISNAKDSQIPRLLLQIQGVLNSYTPGSTQLSKVKLDIYKLDLLQVLLTALKQDFSKLPQGWETSAKLCVILSNCCVGLEVSDSKEFSEDFLPAAASQHLGLARKIQNRYCKVSEVLEDTRNDLLGHMKTMLESLIFLISGYEYLASHVVTCPLLLHILVTDDVQTCLLILSTLQSINRIARGLFGNADEKTVHAILDELVYKISATMDSNIAGASTRSIIVICDSHPPIVEMICKRYKGLKLLLNKWQYAGFGRDLRRLQQILDAGSMRQANLEQLSKAASLIQAWWRSYKTRVDIKKADRAFASFQRSFRKRREIQTLTKQQEKERKELEHFVLRQRKQAMRQLHSKQLATLEFLPAADINKHLENEQTRAAIKIQKTWRGHSTRLSMEGTRDTVRRVRAAVTMQRCVRKWLARVRAARAEPPGWQRPPGLTDERRVELQQLIAEKREAHPPTERSRSQQEELHHKVQEMLRRHVTTSRVRRKAEMHRAALLARLDMDAQLLINAPSLSECASASEVKDFVCYSVPIASKARYNHAEELRLLKQPWWKKLGDEYQDRKHDEEQVDWKVF